MAKNPKKKPAKKVAPRKAAPQAAPKTSRRAEKPPKTPVAAEHRIVVASIGVHVSYRRNRTEQFELRGAATVNVGAPDSIVRTTGLVMLVSRQGAGGANGLVYNPASLNRNLVLTLLVDDADLALLREVFVTGTGSELSDPALTVWATTAKPLTPDAPAAEAVLEYGYSLDFDPAPMGPR